MGPRILFDTNLFVSYLLTSARPSTTITDLFERALAADFVLVIPLRVLDELEASISGSPYLRARISQRSIDELVQFLKPIAEFPPRRDLEILSVVRDPNDDYLIAYAIEDQVDYLVSGDKDLLALGDLLAPLKIRSPQALLDELSA